MSKEELHRNNPLQGVGLKAILEELVTYYGFDILYAYLHMNCFKTNPSIAASAKFLKKTDWAREKVELFYLYQYKNLPKVSSEQFNVAPRERIVPEHHKPGSPAALSIEQGKQLHHKRENNVANRNRYSADRNGASRVYSDSQNSRSASPGGKNFDKKPGHYKTAGGKPTQSKQCLDDKAEPTAPIDPWGNYKKKK